MQRPVLSNTPTMSRESVTMSSPICTRPTTLIEYCFMSAATSQPGGVPSTVMFSISGSDSPFSSVR